MIDFRPVSPSTATVGLGYRAHHVDTPTSFYGATITAPNGTTTVTLTKRDGTQFRFSTLGGHLLSVSDRFGRSIEFTPIGAQLSRFTTQSGRYVEVFTDAQSRISELKDMIGRSWRYAYTASGHLERVTYPDNNFERFVYDAADRMIEVWDRRGNRMVLNAYNAVGRVEHQTLADGAQYHFSYVDGADGNVSEAQVIRPNGAIRRARFHTSGYPGEDTYALGTPLQRTTTYERDVTGFITALVDPLGRRTAVTFDADKRITSVTMLAGTPQARTTQYGYTPAHDLANITDTERRVTTYGYDARRRLTSVRDPYQRETRIEYDGLDRPTRMTAPDGRYVQYGYDLYDVETVSDADGVRSRRYTDVLGRVAAAEDALGRRSQTSYDVMGRVQSTRDVAGRVTRYTYDAMDNLASLTDALNRTTSWTYDVRQRPATRTDALGQIETWSYDPTTGTVTHTDRMQRVTTLTFDELARPKQQTFLDATLAYGYDAGDRLLSLVDSVSGTLAYTYDAFDRVARETTPEGTIDYGYGADGRLLSTQPSGQGAITYTYDAFDRLATLAQGAEVVGFQYDAVDRRIRVDLPNGVSTIASYDSRDRLTALDYVRGATTLGNLTYGYDAADQLVEQGGSWASEKLPTATTAAAVADANHRLASFNGIAQSYDANGNLTGDGVFTYHYDGRDRLVEIRQGGTTTASFGYDAVGRRRSKTVGGVTTGFRYDGDNPIAETVGGSTKTVLNGFGIDERYARDDAGGRRYFLTDLLGSTQALADAAGNLTTRYAYEAYGEVAVTGVAGPASTNQYQYTGRENDGAIYYYRARYYDPPAKRFMAEDPLGFVDGPNAYAYVTGDPLLLNDPEGLAAEHTSGARPSTLGKHQEGKARKKRDRGGEKADPGRRAPRKRPPGFRGPWPPKPVGPMCLPLLIIQDVIDQECASGRLGGPWCSPPPQPVCPGDLSCAV